MVMHARINILYWLQHALGVTGAGCLKWHKPIVCNVQKYAVVWLDAHMLQVFTQALKLWTAEAVHLICITLKVLSP